MAELPVEVRPITRDTLLLVERHLPYGPPEKHAERLRCQQREEVVYLVAWYNGTPVGHALLKWRGAAENHLAAHFQGNCPDVEDLLVDERCRSQGVGTQLLLAAERMASKRGFRQLGLSVDTRNKRAYQLYERLGFHSVGLPPHEECGEYVDRDGHTAQWEEVCIYLVKPLDREGEDNYE
jgi:ribosomal protein S18 acetylase RimI-like enzyme